MTDKPIETGPVVDKPSTTDQRARRFRERMEPLFLARGDDLQAELLDLLCDAFQRYLQAGQAIREHGLMVQARGGEKKRNPALLLERDARYAMLRIFEQLAEGRDRSQEKMDQADQAFEDAICAK